MDRLDGDEVVNPCSALRHSCSPAIYCAIYFKRAADNKTSDESGIVAARALDSRSRKGRFSASEWPQHRAVVDNTTAPFHQLSTNGFVGLRAVADLTPDLNHGTLAMALRIPSNTSYKHCSKQEISTSRMNIVIQIWTPILTSPTHQQLDMCRYGDDTASTRFQGLQALLNAAFAR